MLFPAMDCLWRPLPASLELPEPEAWGIDENAWRRAFVEKCVTEKPGRAARVSEA
jgi:hypothetical protein